MLSRRVGRIFHRDGSGCEALTEGWIDLPKCREWSGALTEGREALPEGRE